MEYTISDLGGPELTGNATTDSNGTFVVNGVATTLRSPAQVSVTVNGATLFGALKVKAANYRLQPVPYLLTQYVPQDVTFQLTTDNNTPVPNVNVSFQTGENPHFMQLPAAVDTNTGGMFTVNSLFTISSVDRQFVTATVDGQKVSAEFTVAGTPLQLSASTRTLTQYDTMPVTFTLTAPGITLPQGLSVRFKNSNNFAIKNGTGTYPIVGGSRLGAGKRTGWSRRRHTPPHEGNSNGEWGSVDGV